MSKHTAAKETTLYGITFPSGMEGKQYLLLRDQEERGVITDLKVAARGEVPSFRLLPGFRDVDGNCHQEISYTPDFLYRYTDPAMAAMWGGRTWHVVETKGRIFRDYPLRKKWFLYLYGSLYVFHEIRSGRAGSQTRKRNQRRVKL